jgi:hypothetical protein
MFTDEKRRDGKKKKNDEDYDYKISRHNLISDNGGWYGDNG